MTIDQHGIDQHGIDLQTAEAHDIDAGALRQSLIERAGSPPRHPDEGRLIELLDAHDRFVVRRRRLVGSGAFFALVLIGATAAALAWRGQSDPTVPARPATPVAPIVDEPSSRTTPTTSILAGASATANATTHAPAGITPAEPATVVVGSIGTAAGSDATTPRNDENNDTSSVASTPTEPGHPVSTQGSVPPTVNSSVPDGSGPRPSASPSTIGTPSPTVKLPPGPAATAPINDEPTLPPNGRG